ncbi:MAG: FAD-dependent oxidoreductase [Thermoguttaceae bacterium]|nr:FAD-dependent oxidoreductase [Thermoguttaceae bacterium]
MLKYYSLALAAAFLTLAPNAISAQTHATGDGATLVEAEGFADKGGWGLDTQSLDVLGSPYLIAHGWGTPVADAKTTVKFRAAGEYRVYARTRNWVSPWTTQYAPGRFQIAVDGVVLPTEFGTVAGGWAWQKGDVISVAADKLEVEVALHDLTGFDGRVDALYFAPKEADHAPTNDRDELAALRREALALPEKPLDAGDGKVYDLVVVGGGIAGTCAAVAAARLGACVALVQERPVLGGNGSSEVRVHLNGEINQRPYPNLGNLTNLMGPHGGGNAREADHYKDAKRFDLVSSEKNIDLYLNTHVNGAEIVDAKGATRVVDFAQAASEEPDLRHIVSVVGVNVETNEPIRFVGKTFADCTGDGAVGYLAGARWAMGREAKADYDEPSAPEERDALTMGSSVQWNTADAGEPTTFPELPWAIQFSPETIKPSTHGDWDWEGGMNRDQIVDMERIRDNGLRAAYGHWSYMKNHMDGEWAAKVKNLKLNWVAFVAGKRESRRLLGDIVLREQDIVGAKAFEDASVTTTWSIDLHYPEPSNMKNFPNEEFRAICDQKQIKPYAIPYRCFYSSNVDNLFMAGRDISVTHIALGTIRVMRTGGMMGEVVGMAASICKAHDCLPRDVYQSHLDELKALMEKGVAPPTPRAILLAYKEPDAPNLALNARVEVSSLYKKASYPATNVNDGKYNINDNAGRWVSDRDDGHWVDLIFDEPTTIDCATVVSGQAPGKTPLRDFHMLYEKDGKLVDLPGAEVADNESPIVELKFAPTTSKRFRFAVTYTPESLARIWEIMLYNTGEK